MLTTMKEMWPTVREIVELIALVSAVVMAAYALHKLPELIRDLESTSKSLFDRLNRVETLLADNAQQEETSKAWENVRSDWEDIRSFVEKRVDDVQDGRARRRYAGIPRTNYKKLVDALAKDSVISAEEERILIHLNDEYQKVRRKKKEIPPEIVEQFEKYRRAILKLRDA